MDLKSRAIEFGIEPDFVDGQGCPRSASPEVLRFIIETSVAPKGHRFVSGPLVMRAGRMPKDPIHVVPTELPVDWAICSDATMDDQIAPPALLKGRSFDGLIPWPGDLEPGVYRLKLIDAVGRQDEAPLMIAPQRAFGGDFDRVWVLTIQLYSLRSTANWGIGDFTDLMEIIKFGAKAGAAGIGLNPVHVLFDSYPADCSPYSPNSRLFLNPLYIDVSRAPDFPAAFLTDHSDRLDALRRADSVDYIEVADLKSRALRLAFSLFNTGGDAVDMDAFQAFRRERGSQLHRFACFEVLRHRYGGPWWEWPMEYRSPHPAPLDQLNSEYASEIAYIEFVQWIADRQLCQCRDLANSLGMPIGLYLDVAVGVKADGFDAWNEQGAISRHASVGAPPDALNITGQSWGLAGFSAVGLEQAMFQPFRKMIQSAMRYAGAIRLDHVLGLQRIYLVPSGFAASEGVYVRMPFEALLAVTAIESQRHKCIVIGEDLGTVPEGFRAHVADFGIWSYRVMMFERQFDGAFKPPGHYAQDALATFSTHDLPTFAGWIAGHDLMVKRELGLDPGETDEQRQSALALFPRVAPQGEVGDISFTDALRFLNETPSRVVAISMEDLQGVIEQPNVPGTIDEHPNWRRKLPVSIDAMEAEVNVTELRQRLGSRCSATMVQRTE